ncbi:MAG: hypothetical protein CM15mP30_7170 [Pelagibacteraceae bacterium]|nr:MAG: hypothetical protein CM15mP30_7170 [Pelagibacteraceae bacterium]
MSENAKILEKFLKDKKNNIIFGINIDEQTSIFYQYFIKEILFQNKILLKKVNDINEINQNSISLFEENNSVYISFKKIKYEGKEKLINFLPYKDVKKYMSSGIINSYEIDKDIKFILQNNNLENEGELFEYLKLNPHMIETEIEKFEINKKDVVFSNSEILKDDIFSLRMEIFKAKKTKIDLRKLLGLFKKEVLLKKFNFLTY